MRIYLDICALKRPWDNQDQPRIAAETALVVAIMRMIDRGEATALRSPIHDEENARNSNPARAAVIGAWLSVLPLPATVPPGLAARARGMAESGLSPFDALHLAWGEALKADVLVTTDDVFVRRARRPVVKAVVPVLGPALAVEEITRRNSL